MKNVVLFILSCCIALCIFITTITIGVNFGKQDTTSIRPSAIIENHKTKEWLKEKQK